MGIGTSTPTSKLQVGDLADPGSEYITVGSAGGNTSVSGIKFRHFSDDYGFTIESDDTQPAQGLNIRRHAGNAAGESALFIDVTTGNVGIGTTSTITDIKLDVLGNLGLGDGTSEEQDILFSNSSGQVWQVGTNNSGNGALSNQFYIYDNLDNEFSLTVQSGSGNVGVGTNAPMNRLDVEGGMAVGSGYAGTSVAPTNGAVIEGNVGIGTNSPSDKFVVNGGRVEFTGTTDASGTPGSGVLEIGNELRLDQNEIITNTNSIFYINNNNNGDVQMDAGTFFVDASANRVGIGTNTPSETLEVDGNIKADNMLSVENFHGALNNADDFINSSSGSYLQLEYTAVQNSTTSVFSLYSDGTLRINKTGVIHVDAQFSVKPAFLFPQPYAQMEIRINNVSRTKSLVDFSSSDWQQVHSHLSWKVDAGTDLTIHAIPEQIGDMDNGVWSTLSVTWTGVE